MRAARFDPKRSFVPLHCSGCCCRKQTFAPPLLLPTAEAQCRAGADLELAPTRQQLAEIWLDSLIAVQLATAGLTGRGQDIHPLHHAEILMIERMAMRDKAADSDRIACGIFPPHLARWWGFTDRGCFE